MINRCSKLFGIKSAAAIKNRCVNKVWLKGIKGGIASSDKSAMKWLKRGKDQYEHRQIAEEILARHSDRTTQNYLSKFGLDSKTLRERLFVNENEALIRLFAAGVGFGTLTESVARPYLEDGTLITLNRSQAMEDPLALVGYPRPNKMDYFEGLIRSIK